MNLKQYSDFWRRKMQSLELSALTLTKGKSEQDTTVSYFLPNLLIMLLALKALPGFLLGTEALKTLL